MRACFKNVNVCHCFMYSILLLYVYKQKWLTYWWRSDQFPRWGVDSSGHVMYACVTSVSILAPLVQSI